MDAVAGPAVLFHVRASGILRYAKKRRQRPPSYDLQIIALAHIVSVAFHVRSEHAVADIFGREDGLLEMALSAHADGIHEVTHVERCGWLGEEGNYVGELCGMWVGWQENRPNLSPIYTCITVM